jgi:CRISPR/Cas system-associated exonuclease Cas4 (RecB family)
MKSLKVLKAPKSEPASSEESITKSAAQLEQELIEKIDLSFVGRNTKQMKKVGGFHPSYTNQCSRYWYYLFQGIEVESSFSPQTYRIFDNGHAVHDRIYGYFKEMGILVAEEIPVTYADPPIEGTADGIIDFYGQKLIELKSISNEGFEYRRIYNKPKDDHFRQAQIYMRCLGLDQAFVIYENKNNQQILPILIDKDDDFIDKLFTKYKKFYKNFVEGTIPDHPYKMTSKNCSGCDLYSHCWSVTDGSKKTEYEPF